MGCYIADALKENTKLSYIELQEQEKLLTLKGARAMGVVYDGHILVDLKPDEWDIELDGNTIVKVGEKCQAKNIKKGYKVCVINGRRMFPRPLRKKETKKEEKDDEKKKRLKEDEDRKKRRLDRAQVKINGTVKKCQQQQQQVEADKDKPMRCVFYKDTTTNKVLKYVRLNVDIIEDKELISNATFRNFDMNQLKLVRRSYTGTIQILEQNKDGIITRYEPCRMTDVDCTIIADMMKCNTGLRQIYLNHNKIGNTGVAHLMEALKTNRSLRRLDIINVDLDDAGAAIVAKALLQNSTLKELAAGENDMITQKGFDCLVNGHKCDLVPQDKLDELDYALFFQQKWHTVTAPKHLLPFIKWLGRTKGIAY